MKFSETKYYDKEDNDVVLSIHLRDKDITDLKGCPREVKETMQVTNIDKGKGLTSLDGAPDKVGNLIIWGNQLTSLKGCPKVITWSIDCSNNPNLVSLDGAPKTLEDFTCMNIGIKTKEDLVFAILKSGMKVTGTVVSDFDNFKMTDKSDEVVQKVRLAFEKQKKNQQKMGKFKDLLKFKDK